MKIIDFALDSVSIETLLAAAKEQNLILRSTDGVEFILAQIDDFDREIVLTRQNQELMAFLDQRGKEQPTVSSAEARARFGLK